MRPQAQQTEGLTGGLIDLRGERARASTDSRENTFSLWTKSKEKVYL